MPPKYYFTLPRADGQRALSNKHTMSFIPTGFSHHPDRQLVYVKPALDMTIVITFCVSRRRCKMYSGRTCLCVCVLLCVVCMRIGL